MRSSSFTLICLPALALMPLTQLSADPPKKLSTAQFSKLITQSPFTIKPPTTAPTPTATPLERDWMLGSIRPNTNGQGYSVTLINKKDRKERIRFIPGFSTGDFQLLEVKQDPNNSDNSRVKIRKGSQTAWLTYDEKLIKVRPAVTARQTSNKPTTSRTSSGSRSSARPPIPGRSSSGRTGGRQRSVPKRTK